MVQSYLVMQVLMHEQSLTQLDQALGSQGSGSGSPKFGLWVARARAHPIH